MKTNTVKEKLARGEYAYGTMVFEFNTTGIGRIVGEAGAEFVIYDMEHTGWSIETIRMLIATTGASKALPMVRVPATQYHLISRPLDVGAMGIMVPMVEDEAQARTIVRSAKYPPEGGAGAAFGVAHDNYISAPVTEVMASSNKEGFIMAQIETISGIENCEAIARWRESIVSGWGISTFRSRWASRRSSTIRRFSRPSRRSPRRATSMAKLRA